MLNGYSETYVPLHGHSTYSIGDGVARINDIVQKAKEIGAPACALTEHGNMTSFLKFYHECKNNDIKPILGVELYVNDNMFVDGVFTHPNSKAASEEEMVGDGEETRTLGNCHLIAYAKDYQGLQNLLRLSNLGFTQFYYKPIVSNAQVLEYLDEHNIVTTACLASEFAKSILDKSKERLNHLLDLYHAKFKDDFYLELQVNEIEEQIIVNAVLAKLACKRGIKTVFGLDYHYVEREDTEIQYYLYLIKLKQTVSSMPMNEWFYNARRLYIKTCQEIFDEASELEYDIDDIDVALRNTLELAAKVDIEIPLYVDQYPKFTPSPEESYKIFKQKLANKWDEKMENGLIPSDRIEEYKSRLQREVRIFKEKGIIDYFLIIDDLINEFVLKRGGAIGSGRGSAAGSLALYILGITKVDPMQYGLIFERFVNPARKDAADVDIDVDSETHPLVEEYLKLRYGNDTVAHIGNFSQLGPKTILKDVSRIFELDFNLSNELTSLFSQNVDKQAMQDELNRAMDVAQKTHNKPLIAFIDTNRDLFERISNRMNGMIRHVGRHASGILISNCPLLQSNFPLYRIRGEIITGVQEGGTDREITELGYLKLDILGLITATVIRDAVKMVETHHGITGLENSIHRSGYADSKVYQEFANGNTRDIFQFGSDSMITLLQRLAPENIADLSAINAAYRPAIIQAVGMDHYIETRHNLRKAKEEACKIHEEFWEVLKETAGICLYQEQLMFIMQRIGNFSLAEADEARKILKTSYRSVGGKDADRYKKILQKFRRNAVAKGIRDTDVDGLVKMMGEYSEYSFNKSHAYCYAINAYMAMFLKVYYPLEYFSALLNHTSMDEIAWFIKDMKSQSISLNPVLCGQTALEFEPDYAQLSIKVGMCCIKNANSKDIDVIMSSALSDNTLYALICFMRDNKINKRTVEALCRLGFYSSIWDNYKATEEVILKTKPLTDKKFTKAAIKQIVAECSEQDDYSEFEKLTFQKEYLGFYIDKHPFDYALNRIQQEIPEVLSECYFPSTIESRSQSSGPIFIMGVVSDIIKGKLKKTGKAWYKILLEDDLAQCYITIWDGEAMGEVKKGDFIAMFINKNKFGYAKQQGHGITIIK